VLRPLALALALLLFVALPATGQGSGAPLSVGVNPGSGTPRVVLGPILESEGVRSSLESGLPVRVRVVTELWRVRGLDALEGRHEWRATLRLDPLSGLYLVETADFGSSEVPSLAGARSFLQDRLRPPLAPAREGTFYYLGRMEVETLSLSDLEELRRWLRGDMGAAVGGQEEVGSAVGRGLRRLFVRLLGLPVRRYEARSPTFTHGGEG
jgi:hypothetical protein